MSSPSKNSAVCKNPASSQGVFGRANFVVRYILETPAIWIPLVVLTILTLVFRWTRADLYLAGLFYDSSNPKSPWPLGSAGAFLWLYHYSIYPAWILGTGGLAVWILAFFCKKLRPFRDEGLFFALMLLLGPGILVNGISKPYIGRPRPILTQDFGGEKDFLPVWSIGENLKGDCNSFPSGHASAGFYLMAPAFVLYRRRPGWAAAFLLLGLATGCLVGIARMAAGGHFASDVVWAGGFVYFSGLFLAAFFRFGSRKT
jgi:membrane-associated PAP2 superfamily phosphatase